MIQNKNDNKEFRSYTIISTTTTTTSTTTTTYSISTIITNL